MIDEKSFAQIKARLEGFDDKRELVIKRTRDVLKNSKQCIYALNRGEATKAEKNLSQMKKIKKEIDGLIADEPRLRYVGSYKVCCQEYVEAAAYMDFVAGKNTPGFAELGVEVEEYLLGLCDLSGELVRKAVADSIKSDAESVNKVLTYIEGLYGQLLELNPQGELRKKIDMVRWNLNKVEDLILDGKSRLM
ncbi:MAG: hypothetical protein ABH950_09775 [Candidatus Altiarchaeota archaeon]